MTVAAVSNPIFLPGDGSTTAFPFTNLKILQAADLLVQVLAADGTVTSPARGDDYALTGVGLAAGGTVTFLAHAIPAATETVMLARVVAPQQPTRLTSVDRFNLEVIETALDRLAMEIDTLKEVQQRIPTFRFATLAALRNMELPQFTDQALKLFQVNATEDGITFLSSALQTATPASVSQLVFSQNAVAITPGAGDLQSLLTSFVPAGVILIDVGAYVATELGNGNGLTTWSLGTVADPSRWGSGLARTATTVTNSGAGGPIALERIPSALDVTVTADGGSFDGVGSIICTYSALSLTPKTSV
jgi:hypothetical protein